MRCAPPGNKPTPAERDARGPWFDREVTLLADGLRTALALGGFAWEATLACAGRLGWQSPPEAGRRRPRFSRGRGGAANTGRLTEAMLDEILARARDRP